MRFSSSDGLWCATPQYLGLYLINELQNIFVRELLEEKLYLFHTYPIVMPTAPLEHQKMFLDYLLKPVANALRKKLSIEKLQTKFCRLLGQLHDFFDPSRSTAAGNLFNLGAYMTQRNRLQSVPIQKCCPNSCSTREASDSSASHRQSYGNR